MSENFEDRWRGKEAVLGYSEIAAPFVTVAQYSLPSEAAPCLSFRSGEKARPIWETWSQDPDWVEREKGRLSKYLEIGSDGAGNPICLHRETGEVWLLDHDDDFYPQFVNSSVSHLRECLLAYMGESDSESFRTSVKGIDETAITGNTFWVYEANAIRAD